jgi:hypothetical protein
MKIMYTIGFLVVLNGCAITPSGPSVGSLGPGSDTAYLNASRGRADAQVTKDQAEQYDRQRQQVKGELELEQAKRDQSVSNIKDTISTIGSIRSMVPY